MDCVFNLNDVVKLAKHAQSCDKHGMGWSDEPAEAGLFFVHDHGVYLMSNGDPVLPKPNGEQGSYVVYAKGMNPNKDSDWYDTAHYAVGGDDFGETIFCGWLDNVVKAHEAGYKKLVIRCTDTQMKIELKK